MTEIPGYISEDGFVNNSETGGGTGCAILSSSKNKDGAWKFLKWWTSENIQYKYGEEVESMLGPAARNMTSNVAALQKYTWDSETLVEINKQWANVEEMEQVPGGYYISRVIDQAFWNVINSSEDPTDMLIKWSQVADAEIQKKIKQYDVQ